MKGAVEVARSGLGRAFIVEPRGKLMQVAWDAIHSYLLHHPRWFESYARRTPGSAHLDIYRSLMPDDWRLWRRGYWLIAEPPRGQRLAQGWKLHVSANARTCMDVLRRAVPVLRDANVPFKFLMDPDAVLESNGKQFSRGSSGKFITVYPFDETQFRAVADELSEVLDAFDGPYILSDRRYRGSRVVYYRYGGFASRFRVTPLGVKELVIKRPDGVLVPDIRHPYPSTPEWIDDPFGDDGDSAGATTGGRQPALAGGRFSVTAALSFSNRGGVYRGIDNESGADVVLREARPGVQVGRNGIDAVTLLHHEYGLLTDLADTGTFVRPITFFEEGEHSFIAEEFVEGEVFGRLSVATNPLYDLQLTPARLTDYYDGMRGLWRQIADAIALCHDRGIVLGDLSPTNILVSAGDRIRIIDLESAFREGADRGAGLVTPGMATRRAFTAGHGDRGSDYYALGGLMLCTVMACHQADLVDHAIPLKILSELAVDLALPSELTTLIEDLYDEDAAAPSREVVRKRIDQLPLLTHWRQSPPLAASAIDDPPDPSLHERIDAAVGGVSRYLVAVADPTRDDSLFPADVMVFETNPLSVAHGAFGCLYALHRLGAGVPDRLLGWALSRPLDDMPPGLYYGTAGLAWALSAMGHHDLGASILRRTRGHSIIRAEAGVLSGAAGYGMACLRLWRDTGRAEFLEEARDIGSHLAATVVRNDGRTTWTSTADRDAVGFGDGPSGVAMFLLALYGGTREPSWLALGREALDSDLARATTLASGLVSFPAVAEPGDRPSGPLRHYWDYGTAGILTTALRYHHVTGDPALRRHIDAMLPDVRRKYAAFPQLFHGLSGIGNALLDAFEFLGDARLLADAKRTAAGVLCYAVPRPEGTAFPGEHLVRESGDLATGSAGTALFLNRLRTTRHGARTNPFFLLDDMLPGPGTPP